MLSVSFREDPRHLPDRGIGDRGGTMRAHESTDYLDPRPKLRCPAFLAAAPPGNTRSSILCGGRERLGEPSLSETCVAGDQQKARSPSERLLEASQKLGKLHLSPDEGMAVG